MDLKTRSERIDPILEIQGWIMEIASTEVLPQFNIVPKSYLSFTYCSLVKNSVMAPTKSKFLSPELVDCLDIIMREVVNAFKGIKEPMHVIMEEDAMYEESVLGSPAHLSDNENFGSIDLSSNNISLDTPSRSSDLKSFSRTSDGTTGEIGMSFRDSELMSPTHEIPVSNQMVEVPLTYSEPEHKDGHVIFNILKSEIMKAFSLKSSTKADQFLDKATFIARKLVSIWFGKEISIEQFNMFVDLLKEKAYLLSFPILVESFRKLGYFEIDRSGYQPFCELLLACLTEVVDSDLVCCPT